uniref:Uncharacterized protein n=1 Tax=Arundo donax TaxID=35708 RepID=A0A0A8YZ93_ARUDO
MLWRPFGGDPQRLVTAGMEAAYVSRRRGN